MDELIVFLMHYFGWTLEYTTELVNSLPLDKLQSLIIEAKYQKAEDDYRAARNFAMVLANWATAQGKKKYRIEDFVGSPPKRDGQQPPDLREVASSQGIRVPKGGI